MTIGSYFIDIHLIVKIVTLLVMLTGLAITPILPGLVVIWLAALACGIVTGFGTLGWILFAVITMLMIVGSLVDNVLMGAKAYKEGAPIWVILLALLAAIVGGIFIPIPILGGILAGLLTLFAVEWIRRKDWRQALRSIRGMAIGWGWAFLFRFIIGVVMIVLWLIWAWA